MFIAKVIGNVVSTQKIAKFRGMKLLLIQPYINKEGVVVEQLLVFMQERLALGGIGNEHPYLRLELHCRWESAAASPDNPELRNAV